MSTFPDNAQAIRLVFDENIFSIYDDLDEDISVEGLLLGAGDRPRRVA